MRKLALLVMLFLIVVLAVPTFAAQNGGNARSETARWLLRGVHHEPGARPFVRMYNRRLGAHKPFQKNKWGKLSKPYPRVNHAGR